MGERARAQGAKNFIVCWPNVDIIQLLCTSKNVAGSRSRAPGQGIRGEGPLELKHLAFKGSMKTATLPVFNI